jgi:hypothetical protein
VQHDRSSDGVRAESWIPTQRIGPVPQVPTVPTAQVPTGPTAPHPVAQPPVTADSQRPPAVPVNPGQPIPINPQPPAVPVNDETVVLPVFVTGRKPERSPVRQAVADTKLPSSERTMLVFVAALLAVGTIAVVAMMGFGLAGNGSGADPKRTPSPVSSTAGEAPPPAGSSSPAASLTPSAPAATSSPSDKPSPSRSLRRSASPSPVSLGALSSNALRSYCWAVNRGTPHAPQDGGSWTCVAGPSKQEEFTPTAVCKATFNDKNTYATVGNINDPTTWNCFA